MRKVIFAIGLIFSLFVILIAVDGYMQYQRGVEAIDHLWDDVPWYEVEPDLDEEEQAFDDKSNGQYKMMLALVLSPVAVIITITGYLISSDPYPTITPIIQSSNYLSTRQKQVDDQGRLVSIIMLIFYMLLVPPILYEALCIIPWSLIALFSLYLLFSPIHPKSFIMINKFVNAYTTLLILSGCAYIWYGYAFDFYWYTPLHSVAIPSFYISILFLYLTINQKRQFVMNINRLERQRDRRARKDSRRRV